jgi:hypothetical protein
MSSTDIVTTLTNSGIGSSFRLSTTGYFISTVSQHGYFETIVKESGLTKQPVFRPRINKNPADATMTHIALTRMCTSESPAQWDADSIDGYLPNQLRDLLDSQMQAPVDGVPLVNEYNHNLLTMAGIGYPPKKSKAGLIILAAIIITVLFLIFH